MAPKLLSSKMQKEVENHGGVTDRMSDLPDSILCHMLSFLPTKTSVATMSLVSRRWRHLWQHMQVFNFADESDQTIQEGSEKFEKFAFFVNAVLAFRKSRDIRKFQLSCDIRHSNHRIDCADMWIRAAVNPNLEQLSLSILYFNFSEDLYVLLPHSLFNCTNLVSLSLVGVIKMNVQHFDLHFLSLKYLKLDIDIVDSEYLLLSACPVLETLHHLFFRPKTWTKVAVPPSSERLKFSDGSFSWTFLEVDDNPNWASYHTTDFDTFHKTKLGIIGNFRSMVEACIDLFPLQKSEFVDPFLNSIQNPFNGLDIQLHRSTSKCSLRHRILNYPEFRNLNHLKFILPCFNTNLLVNVLHKCHMIEVLIIQSNKEEQSPLRTWDPNSITVPTCLKSQLSHIHIEGYQGLEDELTFAEYILRNRLVLDTVLIFVDTSMEQTSKYRSLKRLTNIPRGSKRCQLKFDPTVSS